MPVLSPYQIVLSGEEEAVLAARARSVRGPYRDRLRAKIVLAAAAGQDNAAIARELGVCTDTVRKWRRRFVEGRLSGLADAPRSGRPPSFTAADRAEVIALACALPAESGVPLSRWSGPDLARELAARHQLAVSASTISRWLAGDALKPWQHQSWVTGRCEDTTGIAPFARLAEQVMTTEPYASANRVFWIVDNGSSHRGAAAIQRMASTWPNAQLIHLPAHASWLDQAEIYFSVVQRKVLTPKIGRASCRERV